MDPVTIGELADVLGAERGGLSVTDSFRAVSIDSRTLRPGEVFWAVPGDRVDGHNFVPHAETAGAAAVVVSRDCETQLDCLRVDDAQQSLARFAAWYRATLLGTVVGVTGSVGKTTCRRMIHDVLASRYVVTQSPANFNNHFGVPLSILSASCTDDYIVLEFGASAVGEIRSLAELAVPEIGVVTAIAPAHLEGFGTVADICQAKGELPESLPEFGLALLNGDDAHVRSLSNRTKGEVKFFGTTEDCDIRASSVVSTTRELQITVDGHNYVVPVAGKHHLPSALAAIGVGREAGLLPVEIQAGFAAFQTASGRCDVQRVGDSVVIDDTYNASPASVVAAAETLADFKDYSQRVLILGDMAELGAEAESLHFETGARCGKVAGIDLILAIGLFATQLVAGAASAGVEAIAIDDLESLVATAMSRLQSGDAVLVKGSRAARMERVVDTLSQHLSGPT